MTPAPPRPTWQQPCPCGSSTTYDACCGRLHRGAAQAVTAEELMRSRYSAFAIGDQDHVYRTWHPRTRPDDLTPDPTVIWTGLRITEVVAGGAGDETGEVEFVASFDRTAPDGPRAGVRHERSRFVRRAGRWVYVDGDTS